MHAITEFDKGVVQGTTWHKHPNYITQAEAVAIEQARRVLDYPLDIRPSYRSVVCDGNEGFMPIPGAFHVVRPDHDIVLAPFVGNRYSVLSNTTLLDHVDKNVLSRYPDLYIESVGTLFAGKVAFVNLVVKEFHVAGDDSEMQHRMMYYNPIGLGAYKVCCHTVRIVCNNTLREAEAEGLANGTLRRFSHTQSAATRIAESMTDLANVYLELNNFEKQIQTLAKKKMTKAMAEGFFKKILKLDAPKSGISLKKAQSKFDQIIDTLNSDKTISNKSAWGVLNAFTNVIDHATPRQSSDMMSVTWDALVGDRSKTKTTVMKQLLDFVEVSK